MSTKSLNRDQGKKSLSERIPCGCFDRFKDQDTDFMFDFGPWILALNHQQNFLGRTLCILKEHVVGLEELDPHELVLFLSAFRHWKAAMDSAFGPDKYNIALLGNEEHVHGGHLHWHFVPRYRRPVEFAGETFQHDVPETQRLNYSRIDQKKVYPPAVRRRIKKEILANWPKVLTT